MQTIEISSQLIASLKIERNQNGNKYDFGHALLVCGKKGMMGAAVLAARGALRSGCGLLTVHIPEDERFILQIACPSAMLSLDKENNFSAQNLQVSKYDAIGVGCALGIGKKTSIALKMLMQTFAQPMVIDADALNLLAQNIELQQFIPKKSILTPHDGELFRLLGEWKNEEDKLEKIINYTQKFRIYVISKCAKTKIFTPEGKVYINTTGNAGIAKAGSGDILTGLITGLLARSYMPESAAILGVFYHGLAGDSAAKFSGQESMNSEDITNFIKI
ncbi:MAG: NAD(P)H-hydrate dehydratase [Paludibacter sp.]|nr:NAD(P)H-hydrate dehydratase [Paludibacter sp.]